MLSENSLLPFTDLAFSEAEAAFNRGEIPVGAVIMEYNGRLLAKASNCIVRTSDQTAHAEILVLRIAAESDTPLRLLNCVLYVTLEPCIACTMAISLTHIHCLYFGAYDPQNGAMRYLSHFSDVNTMVIRGGIQEHRSVLLLQKFFSVHRFND